MALLRVTAAALLALAACRVAGAQARERSGLTAPAGWTELPALARDVEAALAGRARGLAGVEAWGEPARGCYGVWLAIRGAGASPEQVLAGLGAEAITTADVLAPTTPAGVLSASFRKGDHAGRLRARLAADRVTALACFANAREPAACETPCTLLLGGLP